MKTKLPLTLLLSFSFYLLSSQVPQGFNYQAIARDGSNVILANTSMTITIGLYADSESGSLLWEETHAVTSDQFGLVSLVVGTGSRSGGSATLFTDIDWNAQLVFLKTTVEYPVGTTTVMGTSQIWSVPYALQSKDTEAKQTLSLNGNDLTISKGNTITLPTGSSLWQTDGTNIYRVSNNVGIGTTNPGNKLEVNGGITSSGLIISNYGIQSGLAINKSDNTADQKITEFLSLGSDGNFVGRFVNDAYSQADSWLNVARNIGTYSVKSVSFPSGNVGIGTNTPTFKLEVHGGESLFAYNSGNSALRFTTGYGNSFLFEPLDHALQIQTDHTGYPVILYLDKSGPIGIGNTNPAYILDVSGRSRFRAGGGSAGLWLMNNANTLDRSFIGMYEDNYVGFYGASPGWAFLMNLNNGNVGIGNYNPTYKLTVAGNISANSYNGVADINAYSLELGGPDPTAISRQGTLLFHHHGAVAHQLRYTAGWLYLEGAGSGYGTTSTPGLSVGGSLLAAVNGGNVGIGTTTPSGKLGIQPAADWPDETPLFEVKNKYGVAVLSVYNNGVKINVEHDPDGVKGPKGGFNIGGYDYTKGGTYTLMNVTPDSIRFNINNGTSKGPKGGFAIGGFGVTKGDINEDFMYITPQSSNSGLFNTFMGYQAGLNTVQGATVHEGTHNTFFGYQSGLTNTIGAYNVFIGDQSGYSNNTGVGNVYIGKSAGYGTGGNDNVGIGTFTFSSNVTGEDNVSIGDNSGYRNNSGLGNTFLGSNAGYSNVSGSNNTYLGSYAGRSSTGSNNVFIGHNAGRFEYGSGFLYIDNTFTADPLIWGDFTGRKVVINGKLHVKGEGNIMNMEGSTYCYTYYYPDGYAAGAKAFLGYGNSTSNDFVIENLVSTGNLQINPGTSANVQIYNLLSGTGTALVVDANGKVFKSTSDARLKENISTLQGTIDKIKKLNGVSFSMIGDENRNTEIGLVAQEVEEVYPELVMTSHDGYKSVKYQNITAILIEGMKEQQKHIELQDEKIAKLEALVEKLMEQK
jgi:hypothetical protein